MPVRDLEEAYPEWKIVHQATKTTHPFWTTLWLVVRVYLGWQWLESGWGKITGDGWLNNDGAALAGYTQAAIDSAAGENPPVAYGWWVDVLEVINDNASWLGKIIPFVEFGVGLLLILGAFTGIAAVIGLMLNFSFVLSGTAGVNPVFILLGLALAAAWRNAGWIGLDRFLIPALGAPGRRGTMLGGPEPDQPVDGGP